MKRAALKIANSQSETSSDTAAMGEALNRLYQAAGRNVGDIVATLTENERARLAVFCYGRVHLKTAGLAIAAECGLDHLSDAAGSAAAGRTIYMQSRDGSAPVDRTYGRRSPITLASRVSQALASSASLMPAENPA